MEACVCSADGTRGGGGLSSLELFSMGLKATGSYMSRALSYRGATFDLASVDIDAKHTCAAPRTRLPGACERSPLWVLGFRVRNPRRAPGTGLARVRPSSHTAEEIESHG